MFTKIRPYLILLLPFAGIVWLVTTGTVTARKLTEIPRLMLFMSIGELRGPYHNTTSVADLDGNGHLDVALVNLRQEAETILWGNVAYWFNQGNGRFSATTLELPPYLYLSAAAGDLDGDDDPDLLLLAASQLMPYINQGGDQGNEAGVFKGAGTIFISGNPGTPGTVYLGDLDNNGQLDAFVAGCCSMSFESGDGSMNYIPSYAFTWINNSQTTVLKELGDLRMRAAALGDLDGDGSLDVFTAILSPKPGREGDPADRVLLNDGAGNLRDSGQRLGDSGSTAVALGDLDDDGDLDAIVGTLSGAVVWFNQGGAQREQQGEFTPSGQVLAGDETRAVFLADFDGDADLDALIASKQGAVIWWNDGQGTFERSGQRFRFTERHGLAVGDFNGDGHADIFVGSYDWAYRVWFNRGNGTFRASLWH